MSEWDNSFSDEPVSAGLAGAVREGQESVGRSAAAFEPQCDDHHRTDVYLDLKLRFTVKLAIMLCADCIQ